MDEVDWGNRPLGVSVLGALALIEGVLALLAAVQLFAGTPATNLTGGEVVGMTAELFGVLSVLVGATGLVLSWGMWTGKGWAWVLGVITQAVGVTSGAIEVAMGVWSSAMGVLVSLYVLWYLWRPDVKFYFGRAGRTAPA